MYIWIHCNIVILFSGLTPVRADQIHDLMSRDYPLKFQVSVLVVEVIVQGPQIDQSFFEDTERVVISLFWCVFVGVSPGPTRAEKETTDRAAKRTP